MGTAIELQGVTGTRQARHWTGRLVRQPTLKRRRAGSAHEVELCRSDLAQLRPGLRRCRGVQPGRGTTDTWLGNQTFNVAKLVVGGVNWTHYLIADSPRPTRTTVTCSGPLDGLLIGDGIEIDVRLGLQHVDRAGAADPVGVPAHARVRGDLAQETRRAGFAVVALAVGSGGLHGAGAVGDRRRGLLLDGVAQMQEGFLGQIGLGDRDTLPTVLVDQVIYQNWLRGEFGSPEVQQATGAGPGAAPCTDVHEGRDREAPGHHGARPAEEDGFATSATRWATATPTSRASPEAGSGPDYWPSCRPRASGCSSCCRRCWSW